MHACMSADRVGCWHESSEPGEGSLAIDDSDMRPARLSHLTCRGTRTNHVSREGRVGHETFKAMHDDSSGQKVIHAFGYADTHA